MLLMDIRISVEPHDAAPTPAPAPAPAGDGQHEGAARPANSLGPASSRRVKGQDMRLKMQGGYSHWESDVQDSSAWAEPTSETATRTSRPNTRQRPDRFHARILLLVALIGNTLETPLVTPSRSAPRSSPAFSPTPWMRDGFVLVRTDPCAAGRPASSAGRAGKCMGQRYPWMEHTTTQHHCRIICPSSISTHA